LEREIESVQFQDALVLSGWILRLLSAIIVGSKVERTKDRSRT
jgi:hypothetical protein